MDGTILLVLSIFLVAAILATTLWRVSLSTQANKARDHRKSASQHREITWRYRDEQSGLGE